MKKYVTFTWVSCNCRGTEPASKKNLRGKNNFSKQYLVHIALKLFIINPARPAPKKNDRCKPDAQQWAAFMGFPRHPTWITEENPERISTMKTTTTLASLDLTYAEEALIDHLRDSGFTEDEIFCCICEDRERREKALVEDTTSDWCDNRY